MVIILIILSASLGMLITLSYHSNKHPSTADEVLRSGKGHIPLEDHFKNLRPQSNQRGGPVNQPNNHQEGIKDAQGIQRKFLEKDVARGKYLRENLGPIQPEPPGAVVHEPPGGQVPHAPPGGPVVPREPDQQRPPGRRRQDVKDPEMGGQRPRRTRITAPEGKAYQHGDSSIQNQKKSIYRKQAAKHPNNHGEGLAGMPRKDTREFANAVNENVVLPQKVAHSFRGDGLNVKKGQRKNDIEDTPVKNNFAGEAMLRMANRTKPRLGVKSYDDEQRVHNRWRSDYVEDKLKNIHRLPDQRLGLVVDAKRNAVGTSENRPQSKDDPLLFQPRQALVNRENKLKIEINDKMIPPLPGHQNKQVEKSSHLNHPPQNPGQSDSQKNIRNQAGWSQQRQRGAGMDNSWKNKLLGEKIMDHQQKDDYGLKKSKTIIRKGIGKFYPSHDVPKQDVINSQVWQDKQGAVRNADLVPGKKSHNNGGNKEIALNLVDLEESLKSKNKFKSKSLDDKLRWPKSLKKMNSLEQIGKYLPEVRNMMLNRSKSHAANRTEHATLWDTLNKPKDPWTPPPLNISNIMLALARQRKPTEIFVPQHRSTSYRAPGTWPEMLAQWMDTEERYCDGHFTVMNSEFAMLKNVIVDRNFCHGRNGGEEIHEVLNQPEDEEYYTYFPGFFQLPCQVKPQYFFNNNNHLNQWLYSLNSVRDENLYSEMRHEFTIAVVRYEYANLYHTTTDFYNAFLLMEYYNKTQTDTNILIVDGHPKGALDPVWDVMFNSSRRINKQSTRTKYTQLVWGILGYNSPIMDHYAPNIPLIEEFRTFFLSSYRIADNRKLDCDKINILFIWRRDYIAHPRNPSGSISRKIQNEQELVVTLRQNFPSFSVKGIQIDLFEMDQQLKFITETDILIGMHGAGLTHAMYLPRHAGMIELLPTYWSAANEHFHAIARWRHLHYRQWVNADPANEAPNHFTKIPPEVLNDLVTDMVKVVCGLATDPPDTFLDTR